MSAILGEIPSIGRRPPLDQLAATLDRGGHASPEQAAGEAGQSRVSDHQVQALQLGLGRQQPIEGIPVGLLVTTGVDTVMQLNGARQCVGEHAIHIHCPDAHFSTAVRASGEPWRFWK